MSKIDEVTAAIRTEGCAPTVTAIKSEPQPEIEIKQVIIDKSLSTSQVIRLMYLSAILAEKAYADKSSSDR